MASGLAGAPTRVPEGIGTVSHDDVYTNSLATLKLFIGFLYM